MDRHGIGGNAPPLSERLEFDHADLVKRATEAGDLVPAQVRAIATDEEAAGYTETAAAIKAIIDEADAAFAVEKKPWLDGGRTVDGFFRFRAALDAAARRLTTALGAWQTAQRAAALKAQREEEAREREAAKIFGGDEPMASPTPVTPEVTRVVSFSGAQASGSIKWEHRVVDLTQLPRQYLMVNEPALRAAVAGLKAQGGKVEDAKIPGVEIFEAVRTSIRR